MPILVIRFSTEQATRSVKTWGNLLASLGLNSLSDV